MLVAADANTAASAAGGEEDTWRGGSIGGVEIECSPFACES
jgi:hypothetical protein